MRVLKYLGLAAIVAVASFPASATVTAPKVQIATRAELPVVIQNPYDETANADAAVDAALARAKAHHKRLLIDLGGNWCTDCKVFANVLELPEIKAFVARHYEVVVVNVGRFDTNLDIPARYGITSRLEGVPSVLVVDPQTGTLVDAGHVAALADARHMTPQGIADWLAQWAK
jgi:thiol-disulfide isomerase/thioredoxin